MKLSSLNLNLVPNLNLPAGIENSMTIKIKNRFVASEEIEP